MTAANSTPLSDGASAVLLASEEWATGARPAGPRLLRRRPDRGRRPRPQARRPADGARLRDAARCSTAPGSALRRLRLLRDPRGLRRPGALHAEGLGGPGASAGSGSGATSRSARSTATKLNVNGGSLAAGHPFAATGGRIVAGLAKQLHEDGAGRGVISICAAGGQGVVAILESAGEDATMSDRYSQLVNAPVVSTLASSSACRSRSSSSATRPGAPVDLRRRSLTGAAPGGRLGKHDRGAASTRSAPNAAGAEGPVKALVFDATGIADSTELVELQRFFYPAVGRLQRCGRVVVLGTPPGAAGSARAPRPRSGRSRASPARWQGDRRPRLDRAARPTSPPGAEERARLDPALPALAALGLRLRPGRRGSAPAVAEAPEIDWEQPLAGKVALVTGASRGIGAAIADDPRPRRRRRRRPRRARRSPPTCDAVADALGGETIDARHHRRGRAGSRSPSGVAERRRRRRPQRRRHPRPHDRQDAGGALDAS